MSEDWRRNIDGYYSVQEEIDQRQQELMRRREQEDRAARAAEPRRQASAAGAVCHQPGCTVFGRKKTTSHSSSHGDYWDRSYTTVHWEGGSFCTLCKRWFCENHSYRRICQGCGQMNYILSVDEYGHPLSSSSSTTARYLEPNRSGTMVGLLLLMLPVATIVLAFLIA